MLSALMHLLLKWLKVFLSNRLQYVSVNGVISSQCYVKSGVPQGSVLGPLLFLMFINDVCCTVNNSVFMKLFADDIKIYTDVSVNRGVYSIEAWMHPASLKKRGGNENHAYFRENWGEGN